MRGPWSLGREPMGRLERVATRQKECEIAGIADVQRHESRCGGGPSVRPARRWALRGIS
jgi:hypothetical protein